MTRRQLALVILALAAAALGVAAWVNTRGSGSARPAQSFSDIVSAHGGSASPPAGGFGFGGHAQMVVSFDPRTTDADIQTFVEQHAMTCGDRGCMFESPFAGAAYNYPDHSVALQIEDQASEATARTSAAAVRGQPGVAFVRLYDKAGAVVVDL